MLWFQTAALIGLACFLLGGVGVTLLESMANTYGLVAASRFWQFVAGLAIVALLGGLVALVISLIGWIASW